MTQYAIRTEHLSCDFGEIRAVDDLSLEVPKGIVFGFLGSRSRWRGFICSATSLRKRGTGCSNPSSAVILRPSWLLRQ